MALILLRQPLCGRWYNHDQRQSSESLRVLKTP